VEKGRQASSVVTPAALPSRRAPRPAGGRPGLAVVVLPLQDQGPGKPRGLADSLGNRHPDAVGSLAAGGPLSAQNHVGVLAGDVDGLR